MPVDARPPRPTARRRLAFVAGCLLAASGAAPARAEPPEPPPVPTPEERAAWWLDRLVLGPEATTWQTPNFHKLLLADAEQNLAALGEVTLARLDDPAFQRRVQDNPDANAWHAVLTVLALMTDPPAETVRAWAIPALEHRLYTLRRQAAPLLAQTGPEAALDAPVLLEALRAETSDGHIAGNLSKVLLRLGPPWDGEAARALLDRGVADQAGHTSGSWLTLPAVAALAPGGARPDLLAWWALLTEASGPRQRDVRSAGREPRSIDPTGRAVVAVEHASTTGSLPAARARLALAALEFRGARASLAADRNSPDPAVAAVARERLAVAGDPEQRARLRANAERLVRTLETINMRPAAYLAAVTGETTTGGATEVRDGEIPSVATVTALLGALGSDDTPESLGLLRRFLAVPVQTRAWAGALRAAYTSLEARGGEPERVVERLLASREPELVSRGLALVRDTKSPAFVAILEPWIERPEAAPWRFEARRLLVLLYVSSYSRGGMTEERLAEAVRRVAEWSSDPDDRSAGALAASLLDLGPAGEARFAEGLRGARRPVFVSALGFRLQRYLSPDLVEALLAPVGRDTPAAERRAVLAAALAVASSASLRSFDALAMRLAPADRPDVDWIRRIVRRRAPAF
jgi:hypothetical protein